MNRFIIAALLLSVSLLVSCRKDKPVVPDNPDFEAGQTGVFIANEGNFQFGNAEISYYDVAQNQVVNNLFVQSNNTPLGDVCQSMCIHNGKGYIVLNNSGKIEVVNLTGFKSLGTITGLTSPRYMLPVSNSKCYVSDLYANAIHVIDLPSMSVTGSISCSGWTEAMYMMYGKVYVTNQYAHKLYIVDAASDMITDSLTIGKHANSIVEDKNGKLWVLCGNLDNGSEKATLHRINPVADSVELSLVFPSSNDNPWRLNANASGDTLYFLNTHVYRMPINAAVLPQNAFIEAAGRNFYGLGICPETNVIYVSDAVDYVQQGVVSRYKLDGTLINTFTAGIIPGHFYFIN